MTRGRIAAGILVIAIGILWLLRNIGLISFGFVKVIAPYWPLGLILIGLCIIFRWKELIGLLAVITVILAVANIGNMQFSKGPARDVELKVEPVAGISEIDLDVRYGAGTLAIGKGSDFLEAKIKTSDSKDPELQTKTADGSMEISLFRKAEHTFWGGDAWELRLSPDAVYSIDIDYGAADAVIDLKGLRVRELDMKAGAASTSLVFGDYPTKASIDTGASSLSLRFPKDASVAVEVEQGISSVDLNGFRKDGNAYYSPQYKAGDGTIDVRIKAGASSITGELY